MRAGTLLPWPTGFGGGEILCASARPCELNPSSYSPCGAVPLAGESPQPPHQAGQVHPFIPVFWNWVEKYLVYLMSITDWGSRVLGEVPGALSCLWVIQWEQCSVWVPAASPLGSPGHDLTVSLPWQQRHPCGEEEEREEEK